MNMLGDSFSSLPLLGFPHKANGAGGGETFFLLKEDGGAILQETNDHILTEAAA